MEACRLQRCLLLRLRLVPFRQAEYLERVRLIDLLLFTISIGGFGTYAVLCLISLSPRTTLFIVLSSDELFSLIHEFQELCSFGGKAQSQLSIEIAYKL